MLVPYILNHYNALVAVAVWLEYSFPSLASNNLNAITPVLLCVEVCPCEYPFDAGFHVSTDQPYLEQSFARIFSNTKDRRPVFKGVEDRFLCPNVLKYVINRV